MKPSLFIFFIFLIFFIFYISFVIFLGSIFLIPFLNYYNYILYIDILQICNITKNKNKNIYNYIYIAQFSKNKKKQKRFYFSPIKSILKGIKKKIQNFNHRILHNNINIKPVHIYFSSIQKKFIYNIFKNINFVL